MQWKENNGILLQIRLNLKVAQYSQRLLHNHQT